MKTKDIKLQALWELETEEFEREVELEKERLRKRKPIWQKYFPYRIKLEKIK